jgi:hypothetical protein
MNTERQATDDADPEEANRLQQYEIVWILPRQHRLPDRPDGFGLEIVDFLGPGDADFRGQPTVWVRGPVVKAASIQGSVSFTRGQPVAVPIPHDQPRACRNGGAVLRPVIPGAFEHHDSQPATCAGVTG